MVTPSLIAASAQAGSNDAGVGTVAGRVLNTQTGEYLEKARVEIESANVETLTDNLGQYRLSPVPAGEVKVKAFYTGLPAQAVTITVHSAQVTQQDFDLARTEARSAVDDSAIKLSEFVVSTSREMTGAAIAINEQRFAPSIKTVIAADEFGPVADGQVGEILKFLPGVAVEYVAGNARGISVNGVPSDNVPVTVNGFNLASAQNNTLTRRNVDLMFVSTNNLSRIEILFSPTPESPGMALAGSINMVGRSAFERVKPSFSGSAYVFVRDNEKHMRKIPGPRKTPTRKVYPGFDFSSIVPVNKRFGFSLTGSGSRQYQAFDIMQNSWRGAGTATNGSTLPSTTPDRPYLSDYTFQDVPKQTTRSSLGGTLDYKLSSHDRVSFSFQAVRVAELFSNNGITFSIGRVLPADFSPTSVRGFAGAGQLGLDYSAVERISTSYMPSMIYRHDGPIWRAEAGVGYSRSFSLVRDIAKGGFNATTARRTGVTVSFADVNYLRPGAITVTDGVTGAPVDPYNLNSYALATATGGANADSITIDTNDLQRTAYANLARDFPGRIPVSLKGGLDVRHSSRDHRTWLKPYTFVGADGRASGSPTAGSDDGAGVVFDESMSRRVPGFGFPAFGRVSNEYLFDLYRAHPGYFAIDENTAYRNQTNVSKLAQEVISAVYLRADASMFARRLKLTGGLRAEQTNVTGEGPLSDPTRNYQRDAAGRVVLGGNGRPLPISADPLATSRLTLLDRGLHVKKEYLRYFPSLNASFNLRENLIARAAYYASVGRPNFNQYVGGVTLPDTESPPSSGNQIVISNAGIKAWSARSAKVSLEYYFEGVGLFAVGAFRRGFENFFGSTVFAATPEFLSLYSLDPNTYGRYAVATQYNISSGVRMDGYDVNYKQSLTFLPHWARGVQVFANFTSQRATGDATSNFDNYIPRTASWGFSVTRPKYSVGMNWNYRSRRRGALFTGQGIEPNTFIWGAERIFVDLNTEYRCNPRCSLFASFRSMNNPPEDTERAGPNTPAAYRLFSRGEYNALWTMGVKGTF